MSPAVFTKTSPPSRPAAVLPTAKKPEDIFSAPDIGATQELNLRVTQSLENGGRCRIPGGTVEALQANNLSVIAVRPDTPNTRMPQEIAVSGMWHHAWLANQNYALLMARVGHTTFLITPAGHGVRPPFHSPLREGQQLHKLPLDYFAESLAGAIDELKRSQGLSRFVCTGHSLGGLIVWRYLMSEQARAAAFHSTMPPYGALPSMLWFGAKHPLLCLQANVRADLTIPTRTERAVRDLLFSRDTPNELVRAVKDELGGNTYRAYLAECLSMWPNNEGKIARLVNAAAIRAKQAPDFETLVMSGAKDGIFSPFANICTHETLKKHGIRSTRRIIPDLGHDLLLDEGRSYTWRDAAQAQYEWLRGLASAS